MASHPPRRIAAALTLIAAASLGPRPGLAHPHLTPEQIRARIQEIDALVPVVKRGRLELLLERAALNTRLDRLALGLLDCRRASRLEPDSARPHRTAGEMLEVRGAFEAAVREYERAVALGPPDDKTCWRLANCYRELGRGADAQAMFRRAAKISPDPLAAAARWVDVAKTAELGGDLATAEVALTRSIELAKGWPAYVQARAELYMRMKRYRKAAADFGAVVARATEGEEEFPMMVRQADALAAAGDAAAARAAYARAERVISRLLAEDPAFVEDLRYWRGRARLALGRLEGARADAREALLGLPDQAEYLELMVAIGRRAGPNAETRKAAKDLAAARAFAAKAKQQFETVQAEIRKKVRAALKRAATEAAAEALVEKGLARLADDPAAGRKLLALAREKVDALARVHPDRAAVCAYHRARVKLALGDAGAALEAIARSLKADPDDARFRRVRLQANAARGRTDLVEADRKFLDALIRRSRDMDLLQPAPPGASRQEGGRR